MKLKSDDSRRGIRRHRQPVHPNREYREQIAVRVIARGGTWTTIAGSAEISSGLSRSLRQLRALRIAGVYSKLRHAGRNVHHQPVPKPTARGRIRIETGDREALRLGGGSRPGQMWRLIVALAAEAEISGQNMRVGEIIAVAEAVAPDRECHTYLLFGSRKLMCACAVPLLSKIHQCALHV